MLHDSVSARRRARSSDEATDPQARPVGRVAAAAQVDAHPRDELVERERLREVVVRPEVEAAQLRREVGACREDEDRKVGPLAPQLGEETEPVEAGQQQIEDDELVRLGQRCCEPRGAVFDAVDDEPLGLEPEPQELEDPRLVLDDQDLHSASAASL